VRVHHHQSEQLQFELAVAQPPASLTGLVREYVGWIDRSPSQLALRELPSGSIPLIIHFKGRVGGHDSFTAGLHDAATIVRSDQPTAGVQANFTALGACLFFNRPLADFSNRTVGLDDVLGAPARRLKAELLDAATWEARFAVLDREITSRIQAARQPADEISWAWKQLTRTAGRTRIRTLVDEIGWSERHFARQFGQQIGMTPKAFARILRFNRAVRRLTSPREARLADLALDCGYFDQAHFTHDFRAFAGVTPSELLADWRPEFGGFAASE
jgi:AraC-like DNA-binding protein